MSLPKVLVHNLDGEKGEAPALVQQATEQVEIKDVPKAPPSTEGDQADKAEHIQTLKN